MHTIDDHPAYFDKETGAIVCCHLFVDGKKVFRDRYISSAVVCDGLAQIRQQQQQTFKHLKASGFKPEPERYGYVRVWVPNPPRVERHREPDIREQMPHWMVKNKESEAPRHLF